MWQLLIFLLPEFRNLFGMSGSSSAMLTVNNKRHGSFQNPYLPGIRAYPDKAWLTGRVSTELMTLECQQ